MNTDCTGAIGRLGKLVLARLVSVHNELGGTESEMDHSGMLVAALTVVSRVTKVSRLSLAMPHSYALQMLPSFPEMHDLCGCRVCTVT
jgi:hypothetical protein